MKRKYFETDASKESLQRGKDNSCKPSSDLVYEKEEYSKEDIGVPNGNTNKDH